MLQIEKCFVSEDSTILDAIKAIDESHAGIALVVDEHKRLKGVITDTDIRQCILSGLDLNGPLQSIINRNPVIANTRMPKDEILKIAKSTLKGQIPVIDDSGVVVDIEFLSHLVDSEKRDNWVIIMAGGLGRRLRPLTEETPKPMLKVGDKPILHNIIDSFKEFGFGKFIISIHYKSSVIREYFSDGSHLDIKVEYIEEENELGTAGALSLVPKRLLNDEPIVMMNADLLTKIDFGKLLDFHNAEKNDLTVCIKEKEYQLPYGVVQFKENMLKDITEKPTYTFFINAGIYVVNPKIISQVPYNSYYDMTSLIKALITKDYSIGCFPVREYWLDVGKIEDYSKACLEYKDIF